MKVVYCERVVYCMEVVYHVKDLLLCKGCFVYRVKVFFIV